MKKLIKWLKGGIPLDSEERKLTIRVALSCVGFLLFMASIFMVVMIVGERLEIPDTMHMEFDKREQIHSYAPK